MEITVLGGKRIAVQNSPYMKNVYLVKAPISDVLTSIASRHLAGTGSVTEDKTTPDDSSGLFWTRLHFLLDCSPFSENSEEAAEIKPNLDITLSD